MPRTKTGNKNTELNGSNPIEPEPNGNPQAKIAEEGSPYKWGIIAKRPRQEEKLAPIIPTKRAILACNSFVGKNASIIIDTALISNIARARIKICIDVSAKLNVL